MVREVGEEQSEAEEKESEVAQLCLSLCNPVDCSPPCSSVHGIFQARVLEWVAISFSRKLVEVMEFRLSSFKS